MEKIDLDYLHDRLIAAIRAIAQGKGLSDTVNVSTSYGKQTRIIDTLNDTVTYLQEPFHEEHLLAIDAAFACLGMTRTSIRKDECAKTLLEALQR